MPDNRGKKSMVVILISQLLVFLFCQATDCSKSYATSMEDFSTPTTSDNLNGNSPAMNGVLSLLLQTEDEPCPANALYIAATGVFGAAGTYSDPLDSLISARDHIRQMKSSNTLASGGITVCIRGGFYPVTSSLVLSSLDSGTATAPIVYRSHPGEKVILSGGTDLEPQWFLPVDATDPAWDRLDSTARTSIVKVDLAAHGITDYGHLVERGYRTQYAHSPMELSINSNIMRLARWPNQGETDTETPNAAAIVTGTLTPDVSGAYEFVGNNASGDADDGYANYRRQGALVDNIQYYLYHCTWQDGGARYWFISAYDPQSNPNCWPTGDWSTYPSWAAAGEEVIPPLDPFKDSTGVATINNHPEDFKEHGFVRIPEVLSQTSFRLPGNRHTRWLQATDIWVQGLLGNYWSDNSLAATISGNTLELAAEPSYDLSLKMPFFVFNLLEELDEPGEYYIDRAAGTLYVYPPKPFKDIRVSLLDDAIIKGDNVEYVHFKGLALELSRGDLVHFDNSRNLLFEDLTMRNNGGVAIRLRGSDNRLSNSQIFACGGTAVDMDGGSRTTLTPGNNEVKNCDIHHYARWDRTYKPAVMVKGAGNRVVNNHIHDAPHFGIFFYGNNHLIEYNRIERVTQESNDAGAIYTGRDWGYRGNMIRYNYFRDIDSFLGGSHGVYLDDGASGISIFGNIFHTINGYAVLSGGGRDNIVTNNVVVAAERGALLSDRRVRSKMNNLFNGDGRPNNWNLLGRLKVSFYNYYSTREDIDYQSGPWASTYPEAAVIPFDYSQMMTEEHWLEPEGCIFGENITWQTERLLVNGTWGGGGATNFFTRTTPNISNTNPLFVDEAGGNLNLLPNSPAFTIPGFIAIPFDKIGIIQD